MDLTEDIEPVTALTRGAADLVRRATERRRAIVITQNGRAIAVLQDVVSYERQRRALHLLKLLAQGDRDHDAGGVQDTAAVDAAIRDRLAAHRDQA
jgi:prevent-host-death family protein